MKVIGKRIKWVKYFLLVVLLSMIGVDSFELYCILNSKVKDSTLYIIFFIILGLIIILGVFTLLEFIKKNNAILIDDDKVIINIYKKHIVSFNEIKDIRYIYNRSPKIGQYQSGNIIFTLKNGGFIKVNDIKDVKNTTIQLRNMVLEK